MTTDTPTFSIIIPTFNHASFLSTALSSVINQTYDNWEVIVVDNHSRDNTIEIIESFNDSRISLYHIYNNGVIGKSRNLGMLKSKGEWVAFLDSDDRWYPHRLESIYKIITKSQLFDVISTDENVVFKNNKKNKVLRYGPLLGNGYDYMLTYGNKLSTSATVVRKNFINYNQLKFSEEKNFTTVEDYDFWLNLAYFGARFKFLHKICGEYLIHESNNSRKEELHSSNLLSLLTYHLAKNERSCKLKENIKHRIALHKHLTNPVGLSYLRAYNIIRLILKKPIFSFLFLGEKLFTRSYNYFLALIHSANKF